MELQDTMHKLEPGQFVWGTVFKISEICWGNDRNYRSMGSYIGLFTEKKTIVLFEWETKFIPMCKVFPVKFLQERLNYIFEFTNYKFIENYPEISPPVRSPFLRVREYFPKIKDPKKFVQNLTTRIKEDIFCNNTYEFLIRS